MIKDFEVSQPKMKLDWKAYFKNFIAEHGEPEQIAGRLVFHNGWSYSSSKYEGPEYPPPKDPKDLRYLQQRYWNQRREKIKGEHGRLKNQIKALEDWQNKMSLPLQQKVKYQTEEGDKVVTKVADSEDLDLDGLRYKLSDLTHLWQECTQQLEELEE